MSRSFRFLILDAFTDTPFAGNPAGVVFHDGSLTHAEMQRIAGELHLETAFLSPRSPRPVFPIPGLTHTPACVPQD